MTYLLPHPGGAILLRRTAGTRHAVQCGRTCGHWSSADDGARALHDAATGDVLWDVRLDHILVPAEAAAWTYDAFGAPCRRKSRAAESYRRADASVARTPKAKPNRLHSSQRLRVIEARTAAIGQHAP